MAKKHFLVALGMAAATLLPSVASAHDYRGGYHGHPGYHRAGYYGHGPDWRARERWQHRRWEEARRRHWQHERWEHRRWR